jgi:hypothetical protein
MTEPKASERRDGPRIDLRLRVRYSAGAAGTAGGAVGGVSVDGEAEASDVSPKGLRLESDKPVPAGSELKLHVDAGEDEELQATGYVTWCKEHKTPTGKTVYDLGVRFESDWLSRDRGPLGSALARIFAMNNFEPARNYERTPISLRAQTASGTSGPAVDLVVGNISIGGMQLRSSTDLGDSVKTGDAVKVEVEMKGKVHTLDGRVAWTAAGRGTEARVADSFGIEFKALPDEDRALLEAVRVGNTEPTRITVLLG